MSARDTKRSRSERRRSQEPSVVGSTLSDVSTKLRGKGLPKGGLREHDRLKVADGALPDSTTIGSVSGRSMTGNILRIVAIVSGVLVVLFIAVAIAVGVLSNTSAFTVTSIESFDSEHVTADEVARLAAVEDVTLLNVDAEAIENNVKRNPWVASVDVERVYPDKLRLRVHERGIGAVVAMNSGGVAWLLGDDNAWIEPLKFEVSEKESANDAALDKASELGVILISDVPSTVTPAAGTQCTDPSVQAVMSIASQLSDKFQQQVVCYSASSEDDISCILSNGVEVSLGSDSNIDTKEAVATRILEEYAGQITYINVRIPSRPTLRRVDSEYVTQGTGATGSAIDEQSIVPKVKAREDDEEDGAEGSQSDSEESGNADQGSSDEYTDYSEYDYGYSDYDSDYYYDDTYDYGY